MSYRNLTPQAMVNISGPWLDPEQDREVFAALPLLSALLPAIEEAHEGIKSTQRERASTQPRLKALVDRSVALDAKHDSKMRGTFNYLTSLAELTDDLVIKDAVLDLRDRLIPAGLRATRRSYMDEAGNARLLPSRLDDASTRLLKKLTTTDGPLYAAVDTGIRAALELERLDAERAQLARELAADADGVTSRDVLHAKNAWIRAVRAVESILALEKGVTPEIEERLLSRLRREEVKADRRALSPKNSGVSDAPPSIFPPEAALAAG